MSGYTSAYLCDATENCIVIFVNFIQSYINSDSSHCHINL